MMLRPGRFVLLAVYALVFGYVGWSMLPHFPIARPAAQLVLQPADLPVSFRSLADESQEVPANPYEDFTKHYRSGYRAELAGSADSEWRRTRVVSTSFVVDLKGAERIFQNYVGSVRNRGEVQPFPPLGQESLFVVARNETSAPVVIIGVVREQNVLISLTVLTDQNLDPALVYAWAKALVERARTD